MKNWVKRGVFLVGFVCASVVKADGMTPIEDRDAFEKQFIGCIEGKVKNNCVTSLFKKHAGPGAKNPDDSIAAFNERLQKLTQDGVYGVTVLSKTLKGEIVDNRIYLLERASSGVIAIQIILRRSLGKWYLGGFQLSGKEEDLSKLFDYAW